MFGMSLAVPQAQAQRASAAAKAATPKLESARDQIGPVLETARERLTPALETARDQLRGTVAPAVVGAVGTALGRSAPARREARRRGHRALSALRGEPSGPVRRWPLAIGCLAVGAAVGAAVAWMTRPAAPILTGGTPYPEQVTLPEAAEAPDKVYPRS